MTTIAKPRLSETEVKHFWDEGYVIYKKPVLPEAKFKGLQEHFEKKLAALPPGARPENMDMPHMSDPKLFEWLFAPEILDLVEPILGPDIALFASHFLCKPKGDGKRVPWHEDSWYWGKKLQPMQVCTVWLAIDKSTRENGCMRVIPRTHFNGYSEYDPVDPEKNVFSTEIKPNQRDDSKAVYFELEPNEASLHESKLMHGSDPNTSAFRRCGYTMRYISTRTKAMPGPEGHVHSIYLARGQDRCGGTYADPAKVDQRAVEQQRLHGKKGH